MLKSVRIFKARTFSTSFKEILTIHSGQALMELIVGLSIVTIVIGSIALAISLVLRTNTVSQQVQTASLLMQEYTDNLEELATGNWHQIYDVPVKTPSSTYFISASGTQYIVQTGTETSSIDGIEYSRYFAVENVSRDGSNDIEDVYNASNDDPSTQKITAYVTWLHRGVNNSEYAVKYITRWKNRVFRQSDWGGGDGEEDPISSPTNQFSTSSNIDYTSSAGSIILQGY